METRSGSARGGAPGPGRGKEPLGIGVEVPSPDDRVVIDGVLVEAGAASAHELGFQSLPVARGHVRQDDPIEGRGIRLIDLERAAEVVDRLGVFPEVPLRLSHQACTCASGP
jgi:hypothetical protein